MTGRGLLQRPANIVILGLAALALLCVVARLSGWQVSCFKLVKMVVIKLFASLRATDVAR